MPNAELIEGNEEAPTSVRNRARTIRDAAERATGMNCYGGIVLNRAVGGLNAAAIERMLTFTGNRVVVVSGGAGEEAEATGITGTGHQIGVGHPAHRGLYDGIAAAE